MFVQQHVCMCVHVQVCACVSFSIIGPWQWGVRTHWQLTHTACMTNECMHIPPPTHTHSSCVCINVLFSSTAPSVSVSLPVFFLYKHHQYVCNCVRMCACVHMHMDSCALQIFRPSLWTVHTVQVCTNSPLYVLHTEAHAYTHTADEREGDSWG